MKSDKNIREGYKRTAVGVIPKEWEVKIFEDLVTKKSQTYNSSENPNTKDIELDSIEQKTGRILNIYDSKDFKSSKYIFNKGDVLFGRLRPYLKKYWKAQFNGVCSTEIWVLKNKENITSKYLFYTIQTKRFLRYAYISSGTKMPRSDWNVVGKGKLPIPPLHEQQAIANCLTTWDSGIEKLTQLIAAKREQKKGLMQQLLTGKKRLDGFVGEWKELYLENIAKIYQPKTISQKDLTDSGYNVYGANGIIGYYSKFNHKTEQIAVVCRGSTCGLVNLTKPKSWITGNAMVINVDDNDSVCKSFLYEYLSYDNLNYLITGSGQPQITSDIKKHKIYLPPIEEQTAIAHILITADKEISLLEKKLEAMKEEKKGLMQVLLTGEKRLIDN